MRMAEAGTAKLAIVVAAVAVANVVEGGWGKTVVDDTLSPAVIVVEDTAAAGATVVEAGAVLPTGA
ncbi:MAG: hypothetical protein QF844_11795, partial [Acidimicrobiales bacterium]|nr:hypothetical protein [Acidimicrobiales bacterium]